MKTPYNVKDYKLAQKEIKHVIKLLSDSNSNIPNFVLKKTLHHCYGIIDDESIIIGIFYDPVSTIIHECLHFLHSDWSETNVLKCERLIRRYIKITQIIKIIKLFANML